MGVPHFIYPLGRREQFRVPVIVAFLQVKKVDVVHDGTLGPRAAVLRKPCRHELFKSVPLRSCIMFNLEVICFVRGVCRDSSVQLYFVVSPPDRVFIILFLFIIYKTTPCYDQLL